MGYTVVNPESNEDCANINPGKSLLQNLIVELEPHPDNVNNKPNS